MAKKLNMADNAETRSETGRRQSGYVAYFPERRSGKDRRKGFNGRELPCYEAKLIGEHGWQKISEKTVMERLVDSFHPFTPIISRILRGEEIIVSKEVYRIIR
jgi:hypothetical protein